MTVEVLGVPEARAVALEEPAEVQEEAPVAAERGIGQITIPGFGTIGIIGIGEGGEVGQAQLSLTFPPGVNLGNVMYVPLVPLLPLLPAFFLPAPAAPGGLVAE